jgi:hypothetical protein
MAKWLDKEYPVGAQVRAFVTGGVEWGSPLENTWQQGEIVSVLVHRDLNDFNDVADVTLTIRTPEGATFETSFQTAERAVTITRAALADPLRCSMQRAGVDGLGADAASGVAEGTLKLRWDNEHHIVIPLRRGGSYQVDYRAVGLAVVRDAGNQIVEYVDPVVVRFAPDVPHETAHAAR